MRTYTEAGEVKWFDQGHEASEWEICNSVLPVLQVALFLCCKKRCGSLGDSKTWLRLAEIKVGAFQVLKPQLGRQWPRTAGQAMSRTAGQAVAQDSCYNACISHTEFELLDRNTATHEKQGNESVTLRPFI